MKQWKFRMKTANQARTSGIFVQWIWNLPCIERLFGRNMWAAWKCAIQTYFELEEPDRSCEAVDPAKDQKARSKVILLLIAVSAFLPTEQLYIELRPLLVVPILGVPSQQGAPQAETVHSVSRYNSNPGMQHKSFFFKVSWKHFFRYLQGALTLMLVYCQGGDWAADVCNRKSTSGYGFFHGFSRSIVVTRADQTIPSDWSVDVKSQ